MSGAERWGVNPSSAEERLPNGELAFAYMMRCADGSLYSGWTNDLAKRMRAHRTGKGAKYTHGHGGETLAYAERCADKRSAMRREAALKKLTKAEKEALAARWAEQRRVTIRMAEPSRDAAAVAELYNWYIQHGTQTFQYSLATEQDFAENMAGVLERAPFLVAENAAGKLCGYVCAHPYRSKEAYRWDVETTIYLAPDCVGQGVGRRLYGALLDILRAQGYCSAFALVTHPNPKSQAFHKALGFRRVGFEPKSGYKFGKWLGLGIWHLELNPRMDAPAPVCYDLSLADPILCRANEERV